MGELGVISNVLGPFKTFVFDVISEYVRYIGNCDDNLDALHASLRVVCNKKDGIKMKVKLGIDKQEEISPEAFHWLHDVQMLAEEEDIKELMYRDINTAILVVKMMGKKNLKRRINNESEMQIVVVKVMKKLREEMEHSEEEEGMRNIRKADYKHVAEVVVEVMKNTIDDFKRLMKEDKNMAVIALRTLKGKDLDNLTKNDQEMKEIVREAANANDEEQWWNHDDEESSAPQPLLVKTPVVDVGNNKVKEAAKKLFKPLANLITPLGKLMDDANFKEAMPEAGGVKLGLEVIDGLLIRSRGLNKEMDNNTKQHRGCCCCSLSLYDNCHGRYLMSTKAECMVKHIKELMSRCPSDPVTLPIRRVNMKDIPTQFFEGLVSRTKILNQILERLDDDKANVVGVFGMGGTGKTTLVKEVNMRAKDAFAIRVMVEISDAPDFVRIQATIAESIGLPLHDIHSVSERAIRLYNKLSDVKKEKKILIILDNVWKKLNLDEVGIPHTCKLLLTTRDKEVCRVMDIQDINILEVGVMNTNEARELFKSQAGNQVDVGEYKNVVERLLSKCGGLPLAIVATANSLKDKDLSSWLKFVDDLEKPISSQVSGDYRQTFTILNTSYKFIQPNGKRIFFLLASLFPPGSSASIESLLRYGIGLNLFEHVNKLSEAMDKAVKWADELTLSSMLLGGDGKGDVKIHDIVRDFAISYAAKEDEHEFMVEGIPRWLEDETLKIYTAMSLTSRDDYSRLSGVEACKLQILILKGDLSPDFDDDFFRGMVNLKVLALSNMDFKPALPGSVRKLKNLRTLCIEGCKLRNIELVGDLVNLLVLSLRGSSMENIPNEIGNLHKLRLLDLNGCTYSKSPLIPTNVLNKLSRLEGLYMYNDGQSVLGEYEAANGIENIRLPYLNALEIKVWRTEELPFDSQSIKKLDKFRISLRCDDVGREEHQMLDRILNLLYIDDVSEFLKTSGLEVLLKKVDYLKIATCSKFEDVIPLLDQEGCRSLRSLYLIYCNDIKCIVDGRTMNNMIVFPCLQSLELVGLKSLEKLCNGDVSPASFSNLQTINLSSLDELRYGLPLVPHNVKEINVSWCSKLEFIFIEDEEVLATDLPFLKTLELLGLPRLLSLVGPKEFSNSYDALQEPQPFFGGKIGLPSLELFKLERCINVGKLWSNEIHTPAFQNLKNIQIIECIKLTSIGSSSVFSNLVQLEYLRIFDCNEMHEVISHEESDVGDQSIVFPQLKSLNLEKLFKLESFYGGRSKLVFSKLKTLNLDYLKSMKMFVKLENSSALFNEKIDFPCLEELKVTNVNDEVTELWDNQSLTTTSNPTPMLSQLELGNSMPFPSIVMENISSLTLNDFNFQDGDAVFSSSNLGEKGGVVWTYSQLPNLEKLKVWNSRALEELFEKEEYNAVNDALTSFCGQVKTLELRELPTLNVIPLHLFKSIASLTLFGLKWNCLISEDVLDSLHELQFLSIEGCRNIEALVINVGSQINFPSLKQLSLYELDSFIGISSRPKNEAALVLPSLETLVIYRCNKLKHFWQGSIFAPRLQDVWISNTNNLKHLLVGKLEDKIELPSLETVTFWDCKKVKCISSGYLSVPKLRKVKLWSCPNMECFIPGNRNDDDDLQLPFLEFVEITYCDNFHTFSLRRIVAPKLTQITYEGREWSMLLYDDLNHFFNKLEDVVDEEVDED